MTQFHFYSNKENYEAQPLQQNNSRKRHRSEEALSCSEDMKEMNEVEDIPKAKRLMRSQDEKLTITSADIQVFGHRLSFIVELS